MLRRTRCGKNERKGMKEEKYVYCTTSVLESLEGLGGEVNEILFISSLCFLPLVLPILDRV